MNLCDYDDPPTLRRPRGVVACSDRTCGAEDCPTCHPECFDSQGRYVGDGDDNADLTGKQKPEKEVTNG